MHVSLVLGPTHGPSSTGRIIIIRIWNNTYNYFVIELNCRRLLNASGSFCARQSARIRGRFCVVDLGVVHLHIVCAKLSLRHWDRIYKRHP